MRTILGPAPCHTCGAHVWVVRRTVEQPCECEPPPIDEADLMCPNCVTPWKCNGPHEYGQTPHARYLPETHTHTIPDVAWTVVDAEGDRHLCEVTAA